MPRLQLTITVYYPDMPRGPVDDTRPMESYYDRLEGDVKSVLRRIHEIADEGLKDPGRGISCMISQAPLR